MLRSVLLAVTSAVIDEHDRGDGRRQIRLPEGRRDDQGGTQEEASGACPRQPCAARSVMPNSRRLRRLVPLHEFIKTARAALRK